MHNELEYVIRQSNSLINTDQQISDQYKIRELETEIGILRLNHKVLIKRELCIADTGQRFRTEIEVCS